MKKMKLNIQKFAPEPGDYYSKINWQNGVTPISASNLNHSEQGIYDNSVAIDDIKNRISMNNYTNDLDSNEKNSITPNVGTSYSTFGGCYYYKIGTRVHIHLGLSGLTANTNLGIYTMPNAWKPSNTIAQLGIAEDLTGTSVAQIETSGVITVRSTGTYALIDLEYDTFE